jgi:predicted DNA-binding transcriptional regulator AlpA
MATGTKSTKSTGVGAALTPEQRLTVNLREAVKMTGISRTSLYLAIKQGRLQTVPVGGRKIVRLSDLKFFLGITE